MTFVIGFHSACNLVRLHVPFELALTALVDQLDITDAEAVTALHAARRWVGDDDIHLAVA